MDELTLLLLAARDGDEPALEEFVLRTQADVWRFCAAMIGIADADDAAQDTFVRAWRSVHTFRGEATAKTWLLAIAKRACYEAGRRRGRLPVPWGEGLDRAAIDHSGTVELDDLIMRLGNERRVALVLTQILGLSYAEAAQICDCPVGTIRSRVARARAELIVAASGETVDARRPARRRRSPP